MAEVVKKNSNVDIAFMIDATGSMGSNIAAVKKNVKNIAARVKNEFKGPTVRVAFVAYRDYKDTKHFEILDFTENITSFTNFVGKVVASGGGDLPEDVLGALNKTINLNWQEANKVFFQIGIC